MYKVGITPPVRMATQLLSSFGKKGDSSYTTTGVSQGLADIQVDIEDNAHLSKYFRVVEFDPVFTAGKNSISFNGSDFLADGSEIKVEVLDGDGNSLYLVSPPRSANYVDIAIFTVAIYVYQEAVGGAGSVVLVGTTTKGEIVRWTGNITINTTYPNVSRVRFYKSPTMEISPALYPVVENTSGSVLGQQVFVNGQCTGFSTEPASYFLLANTVNSNYHVVSNTFRSDSPAVVGFNSQMIGQKIYFYISSITMKGWAGTYYYNQTLPANSTQSFLIKSVISPTEIQLAGDVLDPWNIPYLANGFTGNFSMSYVQIVHISQATTVPTTGIYNGHIQLDANSNVFTSSMAGEEIQVNYGILYFPVIGAVDTTQSSSINVQPVLSGKYTISSVANSSVANIGNISYTLFSGPSSPYVITASGMSGSITFLTSSSPYQYYSTANGSSSLLQKSYANVLYRNLDTFSGFVGRHKLYSKSNIYPGDFVLINDSPIGPSEYLTDPITANKNYAAMGVFNNQDQINQYWFPSSGALKLVHTDTPLLNGMSITTDGNYSAADGNNYVIAKAFSLNLINDSNYYPFDSLEYSQFTGKGYTSNFIFLPKNVLHVIETNMVVKKDYSVTAKVSFYFTSSSPGITSEPNYIHKFGIKIGEVVVSDKMTTRFFSDAQEMTFTPINDYYGTLVIVPYLCDVTLANVSMKNYGDYGFSPGAVSIEFPFPVNVANESFTLKAELFDSNASLIYSIPPIIQVFDPTGVSLFGSSILGSSGSSGGGIPSNVNTLTIQNNLFLPGIGQCPSVKRLLGFNIPTHLPALAGEGSVCYTEVTGLELTASNPTTPSLDYLSLSTTSGTGKSLAVRYSGTSPNVYGRRVYIDTLGNKTTYL